MNTQQIAAKRAELDAEAAEVEAILGKAIDGAMSGEAIDKAHLDDLGKRIGRIQDDKKDLDRQEAAQKSAEADPRIAALKMYGGSLGTLPEAPAAKRLTGAQVNPLAFSEASLTASYKAFQNRQPITIEAEQVNKSFSSVDGLLPAELAPGIVEHIHE